MHDHAAITASAPARAGIAVDNLPKVWAYLSLQQVARRPQDHSAALLLIMISLSLAIYSASTAKTLDKWMHDSVYYKSGADLVVHEYILVSESSVHLSLLAPLLRAKKQI